MTSRPTLMELASREFRADVVDYIARDLGEHAANTQAALRGAVPALIGGLSKKASTYQGATDLFDLLRINRFDGSQPFTAAHAVWEINGVASLVETGRPLLSAVLGPRVHAVIEWISATSGITRGTASALLSLATPIMLTLVGRQVQRIGWGVTSVRHVLSEQNGFLRTAPAGLATALGPEFDEPPVTLMRATPTVPRIEEPSRQTHPRLTWGFVLLALVGVVVFGRSSGPERPMLAGAIVSMPAAAAPAEGNHLTMISLPNGVRLGVAASGLESRLIGFIQDPNQHVDGTTWFIFDRLFFEPGSATLTPGSDEQVRNLAAILESFPRVAVRVAGFTDDGGDYVENLALSQARAKTTVNAIVRLGIARSRLLAEGYGEEQPIADNATDEGRRRNRRVGINVTKK